MNQKNIFIDWELIFIEVEQAIQVDCINTASQASF